jgi:hypothetical protein
MTDYKELVKEELFPETSKGGWGSSNLARINEKLEGSIGGRFQAEISTAPSGNRPAVELGIWAHIYENETNHMNSILEFMKTQEFVNVFTNQFNEVNAITYHHRDGLKETNTKTGFKFVYTLTYAEMSKGPEGILKIQERLVKAFNETISQFEETSWILNFMKVEL